MAEPLVGTEGSIEIDGTVVEVMREWSWDPEAKEAELGGFGSPWELPKPTRLKGSGSCKGIYTTGSAGQTAIQAAFINRTRVVLNMAPDDTATPLSINAYIMKLNQTTKFDDANDWSFDYSQWGEPISLPSH